MPKVNILQKGNIYFFYRPKVQHETAHTIEEVQRFFIVLNPENSSSYIILVVGRKHLPESSVYFAFIEKIARDKEGFMNILKEENYTTSSSRDRRLPVARCLGEGKYLLIWHDDHHTHLCYHLELPSKIGEVQEQFNLEEQGDYLINIRNPNVPASPGIGLSSQQKPHYPEELISRMGDYRFIPLNPVEFLNFEGAEMLIIGKKTSDLQDKDLDIKRCLSEISFKDIQEELKRTQEQESLVPLVEGKWK